MGSSRQQRHKNWSLPAAEGRDILMTYGVGHVESLIFGISFAEIGVM